jgi:hypothetical protein
MRAQSHVEEGQAMGLASAVIPPLTPHSYAAVDALVRERGLGLVDKQLPGLLKGIDPFGRASIDHQVWGVVHQRLALIHSVVAQHGFLPAPPGVVGRGEILVGAQKHDGSPVRRRLQAFSEHTIVGGHSGAGKTSFVHMICEQLSRAGVRLIVFDPKQDSAYLAMRTNDVLALTGTTIWNPLDITAFASREDLIATFLTCFARSFWGGETTKSVLYEALCVAFARYDTPCLADVQHCLRSLYRKTDPYLRRQAIENGDLKFSRTGTQYPSIFQTRRGIPTQTLIEHSVYMPVSLQTEADDLLFTFFVHLVYLHHRHFQLRDVLQHIILIDEGLLTWSQHTNNIEGMPLLARLHSMVREFGIGIILTTTSLRLTHILPRTNSTLRVMMQFTDGQEREEMARMLGLTPPEKQHAQQLGLGECLLQVGEGWPYTIRATFPPLPEGVKLVSPHDLDALVARTNRLAPPQEPFLGITSDPAENNDVQRQTAPNTTSDNTAATEGPDVAVLAQSDIAFLRALASSPYEETVKTYRRSELSNELGDRARRRTSVLGLVCSAKVVTSPKRGGTSTLLALTDEGYKWLRLTPPPHHPGGPAVQWAVRQLAPLNGAREARVGNKNCDLGVLCTPENTPLLNTIFAAATPTSTPVQIHQGQFVAIEIESSRAQRTAPENARRNGAQHLTTLCVTWPKDFLPTLAALRTELSTTEQQRIAIINIFDLLAIVRSGGREGTPNGE